MSDSRIQSLILIWKEAALRGQDLSPEEVCAGCPELVADLRQQIEFVKQSEDSGDAAPTIHSGVTRSVVESQRRRIGPYKLLQRIGAGGMGEVWMAEQSEPVRRHVAIKLIKPGMDTGLVLARFETERQALTLMDHPNIARVLDAGTMENGRPYFVMELVKGVSVTKYCDEARLTMRERLELFLPICRAVQHAHQKGIIHRDLKPSNVLVTLYDGQPVPKVIDFGLAKALHQRLTERTMFTEIGAVVGTPEYMAPEQAELNALDVDTRADIYSLGVMLYEMLTGLTPFDRDRFRTAGFTEMLRIIKLEEPPSPSKRLSAIKTLADIAGRRRSEPKQLTRTVRGELDWIVMKTIDKERSRRYETANGLALDVERYLKDEPVLARPATTAHRIQRFVRRNRAGLLAAALVFLALIGGVVGLTWGLIQAHHDRDEADAARRIAEQREAETKAVVDFVANRVFAAARPQGRDGGLGHDVSLRRAIEAALPFIEKTFANQPLTEARLRNTLGRSFRYLGDAQTASEQEQIALNINTKHLGPSHPETLLSMINLANSYTALGRHQEALALNEEALKLRSAKLGPEHPDTVESMHYLASCYGDLDRHQEALALREVVLKMRRAQVGPNHIDTLSSMNNLANSYSAVGRDLEALALNEETLKMFKEKLGPEHPYTLSSMNSLAMSYVALGRAAEALALREETLRLRKTELGADHPDTLRSMNVLASSYAAMGRYEDAMKLNESMLELQYAKIGRHHENIPAIICGVATAHAKIVPRANDPAKQADFAIDWLRRAVALGYKNLDQLKRDTDLNALRGRDDFKKLIADLESKKR